MNAAQLEIGFGRKIARRSAQGRISVGDGEFRVAQASSLQRAQNLIQNLQDS